MPRRSIFQYLRLGLAAGSALGAAAVADAAGFDYEILVQPGELTTEAQDINSAGTIVGLSQTPDFQLRPFVYRDGHFAPLDFLPSAPPILALTGINERNHFTGYITRLDFSVGSALIDERGRTTPIEVPGAIQTFAYSLNDHDQVAGSYDHSTGGPIARTSAFVRDPAAGYRTFDAPEAGTLTIAWGIDNRGNTVGVYADRQFVYHGFLRRRDGRFKTIDYPGSSYTQLMGLNDRGDIVGLYSDPGDETGTIRGFCLCAGRFEPIEPTAGTTGTYPYNIDAAGRVVGWFIVADGTKSFVATPR